MNNIMFLFPIFFMIHEFEEIIMLGKWKEKHLSDLYRRFPSISKRADDIMKIDVVNFSIIVAEEFLIVSALTVTSVLSGNVIYWFCCLSAFSVHLLIHLVQFMVWGKYIPAIVTTVLCLPYCIWALYETSHMLTHEELILYAITGSVAGGINLLCMHKLVKAVNQ